MKANRLLSILLGNISSDVGSRVELICPEGQTVSVEVLPAADDGYQLILRSSELPIIIAVRISLINRLVSSHTDHFWPRHVARWLHKNTTFLFLFFFSSEYG